MAEKGTYLDPQGGLLLENYLLNKEKFASAPFPPKTIEGFAPMKELLPMNHELMRRAVKISGLKIVFGADALAGMHGRNADQIGSMAPGMKADIIALDGNSLKDITAVRRVVFVMNRNDHGIAHFDVFSDLNGLSPPTATAAAAEAPS